MLSFGLLSGASAQPFPDKTIQYIIPFPPAGESDLVARYQADISAKKFKQPMVVMNRAGAGGALFFGGVIKAGEVGFSGLNRARGPELARSEFSLAHRLNPAARFAVQTSLTICLCEDRLILLLVWPWLPLRPIHALVARL